MDVVLQVANSMTLVWISSILLLLLRHTQNIIVPDVKSPIIGRPTSLPLANLGKRFALPAPLRLSWQLNAKWKTVEAPGMVIFQRKRFPYEKKRLPLYEKMHILLLDCTRVIGVNVRRYKRGARRRSER